MIINAKKSKMTLDKLARMTANEFSVVKKDMNDGFATIRQEMATKDDLKHFATKDDLKLFATKVDLNDLRVELKDDIQKGTVEVLRAVDKIVTKFDKAEKDHAADKLLHDRHEKAIEILKQKVGV
ncbi:MAG: hypothetical protein A3G49_01575 [Candidatus Sungbacteria bacterium RIFCSPLOWO2_12_FULL_41_11]|uniref:Uncharacterized protein n=1 Tax=Candidatus Sungbacteria bacterium RIFCSPLOWO2_12_FULL_41_11 TaxID=1802286 RepID=A0A1G2LSS5_9BACT|nr:MAG: hypothetical protein A3D41_04290 [Candidatus Sungbacteria bacterium RIFCSPHIGHO2_02_FULL_41_12b]OHA13912.1 MAG: hypothetical protein A3G49_01575 [Candidatus Sungbacteria bacterium RIFCSPLOWO2_12_FULL_41_11]